MSPGVNRRTLLKGSLAAGAIPPKDAFRYAFNNGADHILVGMFEFEIAKAAIAAAATRARPWRS